MTARPIGIPRHLLRWWLGISVAAGLLSSRLYWGYAIAPPGVDQRILEAERVESLTPIEGYLDDAEPEAEFRPARIPYYPVRVVAELEQRGLLTPRPPSLPPEDLMGLFALVRGTGELRPSCEPRWGLLEEGCLVVVPHGSVRLLLFALQGLQVSNDHYPLYEFLFVQEEGRDPVLVSMNLWFYDASGWEWIEGPRFCVLYLILLSPAVAALAIGRHFAGVSWRPPRPRQSPFD